MSWIIGFFGRRLPDTIERAIGALHPEPLFRWSDDRFYLAAGGIAETCFGGTHERATESGETKEWVAAGIGIVPGEGECRILSGSDWEGKLELSHPDLRALDGHFLTVRRRGDRVEIFNDQLGLRTMYVGPVPGGIGFASRLDWLAKLRGRNEIDPETFGPHWLTFNQWRSESFLKEIVRLGQGGQAVIDVDSFTVEDRPWNPSSFERPAAMAEALSALVLPRLPNGYRVSLGLSGGFDSRVLLAMLMGRRDSPIAVHIFGDDTEADVRIAKKLAEGEGLDPSHWSDLADDAAEHPDILTEYAGQVMTVEPVSSIAKLAYYPRLHAARRLMIDGGYGEIGRRQFFNRFLKGGTDLLGTLDADRLFPYISLPRADIFNAETLLLMRRGLRRQLEYLWGTMPEAGRIGIGNFLDLLIVRARFPNIGGIEQSRVDAMVWNYMPFAQPSFLEQVFRTPLEERKNARLYRRMIHSAAPSLEGYPLVKGTTTYPYRLPTLPAWAWTKAKAMLGLVPRDDARPAFLRTVREFTLDILHSDEVRTFPMYDHAKILRSVTDYYAGNVSLAPEVDWWLTFELWRRSVAG